MRTAAPSLIMTLAITLIVASNVNAEIAWQQNLRAAHAQAQREGKLLLLHFYSDNCSWCERLEQGAFQAPSVGKTISQSFVPVKVHANSSPKLAEMFKVNKFPTDVIVTTEGKTISHSISPQNPDRYVAMLTSTYPALVAAKSLAANKATAAPAPTAAAPSPSPASATAAAPESVPAASPAGMPNRTLAAKDPPSTGSTEPSPAVSTPPLPGYAASPSPSGGDQTQLPPSSGPDNALTLPTNGLSGGAKAKLAASRSGDLTLEMPEQLTPGAEQPFVENSIAATVTDTAPAANTPPQSPSEQPELAMQGFCPVTVINEDKWVEGKPEFGVIHLGKLYLFTSAEKMNSFLADPVPFTPVLNEIDVVRFFEERKIVPGKREWGLKDPIYNRMFFFADEAAMNHFYNEYERYTDAAIEVMAKAVKDANPGT